MKKIVFTSGLPRSGSTLLSAILNQNPRFHANMSLPVRQIFDSIIETLNVSGNNKNYFSDEKIEKILRSFFDSLYDDNKSVYFNNNRLWTARKQLLNRLYPNHKMIITVRDIGWILDSFERLSKNNIYSKPSYSTGQYNSDIYARCEQYFGLIIGPYNGIKEIIYTNSENCMIIEYDTLVSDPYSVMKKIYEHIEEPFFEHDFNNIENIKNYEKYDDQINMPGLHELKKVVTPFDRKTIIPPDVWEKHRGMEIWKNLKS